MLVADLVERSHLLAGEAPGFGQDRVDQVLAEIAEGAGIQRRLQPGYVLERKGDVLDRCAIHISSSSVPANRSAWPKRNHASISHLLFT
jgi:hypothetical protein